MMIILHTQGRPAWHREFRWCFSHHHISEQSHVFNTLEEWSYWGPTSELFRKMEFEELISVLIAEHLEMKKDLTDVKQAITDRYFPSASKILGELDRLFRQHIAEEEAHSIQGKSPTRWTGSKLSAFPALAALSS